MSGTRNNGLVKVGEFTRALKQNSRRRGTVIRIIVVAILVGLIPTVLLLAEATWGSSNSNSATLIKPQLREFYVMPQDYIMAPEFGMLMVRPQHDHGTFEQAYAKLQDLVRKMPPERVATIWVTRRDHLGALAKFAPLVERVVINPLVHTSKVPPQPEEVIWPGLDHPFLNEFREIRNKAAGKRLLAIIDVRGEPEWYSTRRASYEEFQWAVIGAIGGNFKALLWRGSARETHWEKKFWRLEESLKALSPELGLAEPVSWVKPPATQPASALASANVLFVALVNPDYMRPNTDTKTIPLPLEQGPRRGAIELVLPTGVYPRSAATVLGQVATISNREDRKYLEYDYIGGGELYVIRLGRQ